MKDIDKILGLVKSKPEEIQFAEVINAIDANYEYTPTNFTCGGAVNNAGTNEGSCKILAFAKMHTLNESQTLHLFGDYYRQDVLQHPDATDHSNIRSFMQSGWAGVTFEQAPLKSV